MARGGIKLEGVAGLKEALAELADFTGKTASGKNAVQRGMKKAMQRIEGRAKELVPVDDGDLKRSIITRKAKAERVSRTRFARQSAITMLTGPSGRPAGGNAAWQEFGTVKAPARPFMRPAIDGEAEAVLGELVELVTAEVEKTTQRARARAARKGK
jgi:HK97 gp10 family phage protein